MLPLWLEDLKCCLQATTHLRWISSIFNNCPHLGGNQFWGYWLIPFQFTLIAPGFFICLFILIASPNYFYLLLFAPDGSYSIIALVFPFWLFSNFDILRRSMFFCFCSFLPNIILTYYLSLFSALITIFIPFERSLSPRYICPASIWLLKLCCIMASIFFYS